MNGGRRFEWSVISIQGDSIWDESGCDLSINVLIVESDLTSLTSCKPNGSKNIGKKIPNN